MTLDDNFTDFMEKVDFYLKQQYDSHVEDITILEDGAVRVLVLEGHKNDFVWELRFKSSDGVDYIEMSTVEDGETHSCMVSLQPWAVGSILMSCPT